VEIIKEMDAAGLGRIKFNGKYYGIPIGGP
jgi:hypothetical protein